MNFWHIFDSGSKFKILKPNSSWLTFGISKFVSLSISHFLFLFLQLFFTLCCHIPTLCYHFGYYISKLLPFWSLHLKFTTSSCHISKLPPSAISFQIYHFWLFHLKIYSLFIVSNSTSIPTATSDTIAVNLRPYSHYRLLFCVEHHRSSKQNSIFKNILHFSITSSCTDIANMAE